ncbi:S-adenosyl-L-methionine-dependent methyltransferase [Hymenopellis radicata]|nr:S-adenosyl-L-methionine-dependent methyltransferase [Hymenopellis radicata]
MAPHTRASERWYNPAPGVKYLLPSDDAERERLDLQHTYLTRKLCDRHNIFAPIVGPRNDLKILDSATGTGAWISEVYNEVPNADFIGIDIQDRLFPTVTLKNVSFSVQSVLDLPLEWSNQFDLINQRLLMTAFAEEQWKTALREIHRVLVPGGYVQFVEVYPWLDNIGPATEAHHKVLRKLHAARNLHSDIAKLLPGMLRDAGFENVWSETRSFPLGKWGGEDGLVHADFIIRVFSAFRGPVLSLGLVADEAEYDALVDAMRKEWDECPGIGLSWTKAYACK